MKHSILRPVVLSTLVIVSCGLYTGCNDDKSTDTTPQTSSTAQASTETSATDANAKVNAKQQEALPPKYLSVQGFKACTSSKDKGTWQAICLPSTQPKDCSDDAWPQLVKLHLDKGLESCDDTPTNTDSDQSTPQNQDDNTPVDTDPSALQSQDDNSPVDTNNENPSAQGS